jgi:hypothetical protein
MKMVPSFVRLPGRLLRGSLPVGLLTVTGCVLSAPFARAQAPAVDPQATQNIIRQVESIQQEQANRQKQKEAVAGAAPQESDIPETYPGENSDLGPQMLLKQKAPQRKPLFEFSTDTMFTWSSNALGQPHSQGSRQDTGAVAQTFSLAIAPEPVDLAGGKLSWRGGYRHLFYIYNALEGNAPLNLNNFQMSTLFVGSNFTFKENWNAGFGIDYNRLLFQKRSWDLLQRPFDPSNWKEGYTELKPNWSLSRNIGLAEKLNLSVGYSGAYHFSYTDPIVGDTVDYSRIGNNFENGLSLSLIWAPVEKFLLIPSFRVTHYVYTEQQRLGSRQDRTLSPGITAMYSLNQRISFRVSMGGEFRHSTIAMNSNVRKFDTGCGVSLAFKF